MKIQDVTIYKHTQSDSLIVSCSSPNKTEKIKNVHRALGRCLFDRGPAIHIALMWDSCCIDIARYIYIYVYVYVYVPMHLYIVCI